LFSKDYAVNVKKNLPLSADFFGDDENSGDRQVTSSFYILRLHHPPLLQVSNGVGYMSKLFKNQPCMQSIDQDPLMEIGNRDRT
jgi:hypothetical protein